MNISKHISCIFIFSLFFYAFSGLIKWLVFFVDPTLFFGVLTLFAIPFYIDKHKIHFGFKLNYAIWSYIGVYFLIFLSVIYTVSDNYYLIKSGKILFNFLAILMPILILRNYNSFLFLKTISKFSLIFCLLILSYGLLTNNLYWVRYQENNLDEQILTPDYMSISYFLGTMILFLWETKSKPLVLLLICAFIFMIVLAAKGPILFLLPCIFIFHGKSLKIFSFKSFYLALVFVTLIATLNFFLGGSVFNNLIGRLSFFDGGIEADKSSFERIFLMSKSLEIIKDNFIGGVGIGGFSKAINGVDVRLSPHNIFLELWAEVGIFSLLLFFLMIYFIFKEFKFFLFNSTSNISTSIISVNLYLFLALIVSSYVEDMRLNNFWIGVSIAFFSLEYKNSYNVRYNRNSK
jgi:O-antigen ligase